MPYLRRKRSTRPAVSTIFCLPVKNGCDALEMSSLISGYSLPSSHLMVFSDFITYVVTSFQLAFAFPDATGGFWGAVGKFLGIFAITQVPLALIEGLVGILLFRFLAKVAAPQLKQLGVLDDNPEVAHA